MRIGQGVDAHRFCDGEFVILGGVEIPHTQGLEAHSDGDVLIHALCDALLGAAGLGDIGRHFPDTDDAFLGIDSRVLLRRVVDSLKQNSFKIINVDLTVIAQLPKINPHVEAMKNYLSQDLSIDASLVNVKATTTEKMGFTGRGEGIAAMAVTLIESTLNE